jgi:SAM-dependent methyltransferase
MEGDNSVTFPLTDPANLFRLRDSVYAPDLFIVAVGHLNFFSWLRDNPATVDEIISSFRIQRRPADVMLTLFKSLDLIQEREGRFHLTALAKEHLTDSSQWYLGPYVASLKDRPICHDMLNVLRTGKPASWGAKKDEKEWVQAMAREDFAESFTAGMDSRGAYLAPALARGVDLSNHERLLDVAGGSGIYASAFVLQQRHISAAVFEKPPVDSIAKSFAEKRNLSNRISVIAGDMFDEELPAGFDVHLFSHVLHDWDCDNVRKLLENSYRNLEPGGMVVIHDAHLRAGKDGPLPVAEYSVLLMFSTEGKCYSISEMQTILEETGFSDMRFIPTAAHRSAITARKPK